MFRRSLRVLIFNSAPIRSQIFCHYGFNRLLVSSSICFKKHNINKHLKKEHELKIERLKHEAPFIFKSSKRLKKHYTQLEIPIIFKPIKVKKENLVDDHSHLLHDLKIKPTLNKENVFIVQPNFKWGNDRYLTKLVDCRLAEAKALIESVNSWDVYSTVIESVHENNPKYFFGSGKTLELSEQVRTMINEHGVTMVFLNIGRLSLRQIRELESAWGCKVFDRYRVVLELFKERASTKEAKLQVQLAEIQYLRTHLTSKDAHYDQQRGGGKSMMGTGETYMEKVKRHLFDSEKKINKQLLTIKHHQELVKKERFKKQIPQVALVGYTNAGKTTLAKLLSNDVTMNPENKLFATLDTTAHEGKLPSGMSLLYIDTVGFISDLPHELVESFTTTLEDMKSVDIIVHVSDYSHPEFNLQKETVENVLAKLNFPEHLQANMIHVLNKCDLQKEPSEEVGINQVKISATEGVGIEELRARIEEHVIRSTGRKSIKINVDQQGSELSWLYRHGTVIDTIGQSDGSLDIVAILDQVHRKKFENRYLNVKIMEHDVSL